MRLKIRILLIIAASLAGLMVMGTFGLYSMQQDMLEERQGQVSLLLDFARAQMEHFHQREIAGELTREEAQASAREVILAQQTKKDYFIVRDLADNRLLVHATASRIGKIDPGGKMPDGKPVNDVYKERIKTSADGKGYVTLMAAHPNSNDPALYRKLNGAAIFEPWNWMVVIGFFVDDVDTRFWEESVGFFIVGGILLVLLAGLTFRLLHAITQPLTQIQTAVMKVRNDNDFTQEVTVVSKDEIGQTAEAFNALLLTLRETFAHFKESVSGVFGASESLVSASKESARAATLTSEAASSIAASVEEMSASINQVSDNASSASELANKAGQLSGEGGEVIASTVKEMQRIADAIDRVAGAIGDLGQQSDQISSIVQVIKEVADQTNLLALNAAIEAARAGEAGRGFAVVADEVRKLSERTTKATVEISSMISGIQTSSSSAVTAMQQTVAQVRSGREMAEQAGQAIVEIRKAASEVVNVVKDIAGSIAEQSSAAQSIAQQLEQVAQAAEKNSSASAETSDSARQLGELANGMQSMTEKFTI